MVTGGNWGWSSTTNDTWIDSTSTTDSSTIYYTYPTYYIKQGSPSVGAAPPPEKPKPEGILEWLDRRVDEVRLPLAA